MIYTALIGYPTKHSLSPQLFRLYADSVGLEYSHIKIDISPKGNALKSSLSALKKLKFTGLNVTIPYKLNIIPLLDEVDHFSSKIGAVNTVKIDNNFLIGTNTDYFGVIKSIEKSNSIITKESKAVIFGSGGAAKACAGGLLKYTQNVSVCFREPKSYRTKDFMSRFPSEINFISDKDSKLKEVLLEANIICNATPVGMPPNTSESILICDISLLKENDIDRVFFDAVYTPLRTQFLTNAIKNGYKISDGLDMMIYQGVEAFKIWTGKEISISTANQARQYILNSRNK